MGLETLMISGIVMGVASAVWQGVSSYTQGQDQQAMAEYNAAVARNQSIALQNQAEYNAAIMRNNQLAAEQDADAAERDARVREQKQRQENERMQEMQRAGYAKSGVIMEGTPLAVMGESASNLEMDALEIRRQGLIEKNNYLRQANAYGSQAALYDYQGGIYDFQGQAASTNYTMQGNSASRAGSYGLATGMMNAGGSLLSGASKYSTTDFDAMRNKTAGTSTAFSNKYTYSDSRASF